MSNFPNPFSSERLIGTVTRVSGSFVQANLPHAADASARRFLGSPVPGGVVGEFVVVECGHLAILGRIDTVRLPERDRLQVEKLRLAETRDAHPVGDIQLMASADLSTGRVTGGITVYPRVGAQVFSAEPRLMQIAARAGHVGDGIDLATLLADKSCDVKLMPDDLLARHCAVVGTTGGGKSYTLARIIEEGIKFKYKTVLIDATGEFRSMGVDGEGNLNPAVTHLTFDRPQGHEKVVRLPYTRLEYKDFEVLFTPAGQSQSPKLREAVRSLMIARLMFNGDANYQKLGKTPQAVAQECQPYRQYIEFTTTEFNIQFLTAQIQHECVNVRWNYTTKQNEFQEDSNSLSYVQSLLTRIDAVTNTDGFRCLFNAQHGEGDFLAELDEFLADPDRRVLRLSVATLLDEFDVPAIMVNAITRHLLVKARNCWFKQCPLVFAVDEAHRFTEKATGETERFRLNQLELVSKMGRKDGLYLLIATQRPRDLGPGILSQVGAVVSHRLTHGDDRQAVERVAGEFDRNAIGMLANLTPGQAVITGINFPVPVTVKIAKPKYEPKSDSPPLSEATGACGLVEAAGAVPETAKPEPPPPKFNINAFE